MAFTMLFSKKISDRKITWWRWLKNTIFLCVLAVAAQVQAQSPSVEITSLKVAKQEGNWLISADVKFELPTNIEDAMYKGVSLTFVSEVEVMRERWYWLDKTIVQATRQTRISYQALTRRWRVLPWSEVNANSGLGVQLPSTYETLSEALAMAQRIYQWRIPTLGEVDDGAYFVQLRYKLDTSQLPKPLQIGLLGQGEWLLNTSIKQRFHLTDGQLP